MTRKRHFLIPILLHLFSRVSAQINESDTAKFQLRAGLNGNYQQGNVELLTLKSKIDFSVTPFRNWMIKSQNNSLYQEFYKVEADNDIFSRNYIYYKPQNKFYPFVIAYISTNYRRKIDSRYFAGAGVTFQAINSARHVLKLSASIIYESSKFNGDTYNFQEYNGNSKINLYRGTLYAGGWDYLFQKKVRFYYDLYWQSAFNNSNNYRWQADIGIDFLVWKGLNANALYTLTHENVVASGIMLEDKILTFGIAYNFNSNRK